MIRSQKERLEVLRKLLEGGEACTQDELREKLERQDFEVTQSTVSRDLRKLGAVRAVDAASRTVYRLPDVFEPPVAMSGSLGDLVKEMTSNGYMIVIHTVVGSASMVARHLDNVMPEGVLGTIAGDDTIFVAPTVVGVKELKLVMQSIRDCLNPATSQ